MLAICEIEFSTPLCLFLFPLAGLAKPLCTKERSFCFIAKKRTVFGHGAHRILRVLRMPDLSCNREVKWQVKRVCNFIAKYHPAARESIDHRIVPPIRLPVLRQLFPPLFSLSKH